MEVQVNRTGRIVVGIIAIVASLASAGWSVKWFVEGRIKHGLLFAAVFVVLLLFGIIMMRSSGKSGGGASA